MFKDIIFRLIIIFLLLFIAWIAFVPEPWQIKYGLQVKYVLFFLFLISLARYKFNLQKYCFSKDDYFFWLYLLLISLNIWFAKEPTVAWNFYRDLSLNAILIYFIFKNEINEKNMRWVLYGLCLCAAAVSLFGYFEMLFKKNFIYEYLMDSFCYQRFIKQGRMMSTLMHPNILGVYLLVCVPAAYYFYKKVDSVVIRALNLSVFLLILSAIFLTYSRGTYLAFLLMLSILAILKRKFRWLFFIWGMFIFFSFIINLSALFLKINTHLVKRFGIFFLFNYLRFSHRVKQYFITANILKIHPFVGIGLNHYRMLFNQYSGGIKLSYELMVPESVYLMHLAETGLIGFTGMLLFLINIFKKIVRLYKEIEGESKGMFFVLIMGFIGLLINMASFDGFLWRTPFYLFWILVGMITGSSKIMPRRV